MSNLLSDQGELGKSGAWEQFSPRTRVHARYVCACTRENRSHFSLICSLNYRNAYDSKASCREQFQITAKNRSQHAPNALPATTRGQFGRALLTSLLALRPRDDTLDTLRVVAISRVASVLAPPPELTGFAARGVGGIKQSKIFRRDRWDNPPRRSAKFGKLFLLRRFFAGLRRNARAAMWPEVSVAKGKRSARKGPAWRVERKPIEWLKPHPRNVPPASGRAADRVRGFHLLALATNGAHGAVLSPATAAPTRSRTCTAARHRGAGDRGRLAGGSAARLHAARQCDRSVVRLGTRNPPRHRAVGI
jgi:hypothetical protein